MRSGHGKTDKEYVFGLQNGFFSGLYSMCERGNFRYGVEALPADSFELRDRILRCIDEGTPGGVHAAGSGILLSTENAMAYVKNARPTGMTNHKNCAAEEKAFLLQPYEVREVLQNAANYGRDHLSTLSRCVGLKLGQVKKLARSEDTHIARMAVYDGTGRFDNSRLDIMPQLAQINGGLLPTFVISRRYHADPQDAVNEADIAARIALGDHGFEKLITPDTPFLVMVIGDGNDKSKRFSSEALLEEVEGLRDMHKGRVIVDGFNVNLPQK